MNQLHRTGSRPGRTQSGVALVIALLVLVMTAALGVTVMNVSSAELSLAGINESNRTAFHAADSAADAAVSALSLADIAPTGVTAVDSVSVDDRVSVDVTARLEGSLPEFGSSLRLFARTGYAIKSAAVVDGTGAVRRVVAGVSVRVPRAP